jgi:hypothetical protein
MRRPAKSLPYPVTDRFARMFGHGCGSRRSAKAPIAIEAVKRIDAPFVIERYINGMTPQERVRVRNERSRPLVLELELKETRRLAPLLLADN